MLSLFRRAAPKPEPTELSVAHGSRVFQVQLNRRSTARRLTLRVSSASGIVTLTVPPGATFSAARVFAEAHGGWIAARLARLPERVVFEPGAIVPLRDVPHRVLHQPLDRGVKVSADPDGAPVLRVGGDGPGVPGRVRRFLASEAQRDIRDAVARHTGALGIPARRVTIRDTRSRWGSCSSAGALSFSWRLIMAPPLVLDYLAAHEVAHLKELNHSHRFWKLVHDLCPETETAERWLKRHGSSLHTYG